MQIRYKSDANVIECPGSVSNENLKRVTDFHFNCKKNVSGISVISASESQQCHYEIRMDSKDFCDCDNCAQNHSSCYNGKCQCDQYTTGETFFIGDLKCEYTKLINPTKIEILTPPGSGNQSITITDGISSYLSPFLFEYTFTLCLNNCSQSHGVCDLSIGVCACDNQTNGTVVENPRIYIDSINSTYENGGTAYLYGYFGNTFSNLFIQIRDSHCNNTQQINETLIKFDLGEGSGFKDVSLQERDLQVKVEKLFQYFAPITTNPPK